MLSHSTSGKHAVAAAPAEYTGCLGALKQQRTLGYGGGLTPIMRRSFQLITYAYLFAYVTNGVCNTEAIAAT